MGKPVFLALALSLSAGFGLHTASAQFPGGLPRILRPGRPRPTPTPAPAPAESAPPATTVQPPAGAGSTASPVDPAAAGPTGLAVMKNWVQFTTRHVTSYKGDYKIWSWNPIIRFETIGPIPSGSSYYAVVTQPNGALWELDCTWEGKDYQCGGPNYPEDRATTASGVFPFSIKMRNPLAGTADVTLFSGKVKIDTAPSTDVGTPAERAKKLLYFTNQEWAMPIGYVFMDSGRERLNVAFWVRGGMGGINTHLFYRGQEIADTDCSSEMEIRPSTSPADSVKVKPEWKLLECDYVDRIKLRDNGERRSFQPHYLSANPGEYEIKVLRNNKLSRLIKFTVGPDGKFTGGIPLLYKAETNSHSSAQGVIVPVQILDDQDGPWDKNAWRTYAFYGNPPTGFSPPQ